MNKEVLTSQEMLRPRLCEEARIWPVSSFAQRSMCTGFALRWSAKVCNPRSHARLRETESAAAAGPQSVAKTAAVGPRFAAEVAAVSAPAAVLQAPP